MSVKDDIQEVGEIIDLAVIGVIRIDLPWPGIGDIPPNTSSAWAVTLDDGRCIGLGATLHVRRPAAITAVLGRAGSSKVLGTGRALRLLKLLRRIDRDQRKEEAT